MPNNNKISKQPFDKESAYWHTYDTDFLSIDKIKIIEFKSILLLVYIAVSGAIAIFHINSEMRLYQYIDCDNNTLWNNLISQSKILLEN